jgi:hypothetical protein
MDLQAWQEAKYDVLSTNLTTVKGNIKATEN